MNKPSKERIAACRQLLQNPYAFVEYLDELEELPTTHAQAAPASSVDISASRKLLEDPYAYLDGDGRFSAPDQTQETVRTQVTPKPNAPANTLKRRLTDAQIKAAATSLQRRLWLERDQLWDGAPPENPIELLDIRKALHLVGYQLVFESGLGHDPRTHIEVAGLIDRDLKIVRSSMQFLEPYQRFTLAHELGHAVLHPHGGGIHRDRPLDGVSRSRAPDEMEADRFATHFLMPEKLVRDRFERHFHTQRFELTEGTAFALFRASVDEALKRNSTRRHLAYALAAAKTYNGHHFKSLASQFGVSVGAMAIRLEELGLLDE